MSNIIRPTFGAGRAASGNASSPTESGEPEWVPLKVYGTAAGHLVALMRDDAAPEGPVVKVVVGPEAGNTIEAVAIMPASPEGEINAGVAAMAVLRTLKIVGGTA